MRVLAHDGDAHLVLHVVHQVRQLLPLTTPPCPHLPLLHVALAAGQLQDLQNALRSVLLAKHQRHVVDVAHVVHAQHVLHGHVAEQRDLLLRLLRVIMCSRSNLLQRRRGTAHQEVRRQSGRAQLLHRRLRGLRLLLAAGYGEETHVPNDADHGDQTHVAENGVVATHALHQLAHRLQEHHRLDISDRSAHLDQTDIGLVAVGVDRKVGHALDPVLYVTPSPLRPTWISLVACGMIWTVLPR